MLRKTVCLSLLCFTVIAVLPQEAQAQRRVIRRTAPRSVVYVAARPYYPVYYSPFFAGWYGSGWYGYGWPGWYGYGYGRPGWYPYGFYGQHYPYRYRYDDTGSARIEVKPREAQVFVDGYFVGTVDDFDGWLQRLHVPYGEHEIQIYMPGYRTLREKVLFRPGATIKINGTLEPLPAGETADQRPAPEPGTQPPGRGPDQYPAPRRPRGEYPAPPRGGQDARAGEVAIRVQPGDAEVRIDGERWDSPQGGERLVVQLSEGEHRVEIRREGYAPFTTTIRIRRGETYPLNVSLTRQDQRLDPAQQRGEPGIGNSGGTGSPAPSA